jgi:hypothetical protein
MIYERAILRTGNYLEMSAYRAFLTLADWQPVAVSVHPYHQAIETCPHFVGFGKVRKNTAHLTALNAAMFLIAAEALVEN